VENFLFILEINHQIKLLKAHESIAIEILCLYKNWFVKIVIATEIENWKTFDWIDEKECEEKSRENPNWIF
jgi:hypothetical protein